MHANILICSIDVAYTARHTGPESTAQTRLELEQQRQKLLADIRAFNNDAKQYLPAMLFSGEVDFSQAAIDVGAEWDDLEGFVTSDTAIDDDPTLPKNRPIALPSTLGVAFLKKYGLMSLAVKERALREGDMNECLLGLRAGIGYKSYVYYAKIRNASSFRARLRSFDDIHITDHAITKHVRTYTQCRQAADRLFDMDDDDDRSAHEALMRKYEPIQRSDLKVNTTVVEPFSHGMRDLHAAWFWRLGDGNTNGPEETPFVRQCEWACVRINCDLSHVVSASFHVASRL